MDLFTLKDAVQILQGLGVNASYNRIHNHLARIGYLDIRSLKPSYKKTDGRKFYLFNSKKLANIIEQYMSVTWDKKDVYLPRPVIERAIHDYKQVKKETQE